MRKAIPFLVALLALTGRLVLFGEPVSGNNQVAQSEPEERTVDVLDPNGRSYFPPESDNWYGKHLLAMAEPSLFSFSEPVSDDQIRFLCLPTFSKPICFRGFKTTDGWLIRVVRLTGQGGYDPGRIEIDAKVRISEEEWAGLVEDVSKSITEFKLTSDQESLLAGLDGTQWILEARINGNYHFQEVQNPMYWTSKEGIESLELLDKDFGGKYQLAELNIALFRDACRQFLQLTDFEIPSRMVPSNLRSESGPRE
jgi:hypothetical protein